MANPWTNLPSAAPYVLPCDRAVINAHNSCVSKEYQYRLDLLPEPYFGERSAPVVILMSNPGVGAQAAAVHRQPAFVRAARASLLHELSPDGPFLHLRTEVKGGGRDYWRKRTRELADHVGYDWVQQGLLVLQLAPYHSLKFKATKTLLPSQAYTLHLLDAALDRDALVLVMRGERFWLDQAPRLRQYRPTRLFRAANARSTYLTPGNLKAAWPELLIELAARRLGHG